MLLTIGLEIHIKLKSANKMFCQCKNEQNFDNLVPNTNICPVCTGQPGALPTLSEEVLEKALLLGKALQCTINEISTFDRKSYFYPDLPMGYQITQLYHPTNTEGKVAFFLDNYETEKIIHIQDAHMECDTGKMIHNGGQALLDFNRAGTPLVEIVTNPDFSSSEEVIEFLKELQRIVRFNDIADADLEKGQMRVDVNISVRNSEKDPFGTRVEVKNMNSFSAIKRAIEHEYERQVKMYERGEIFSQQTRGRDDAKGESYLMRSKEDALDYRYFPEPDLPPLKIDDERMKWLDSQKTVLPHTIIKQFKGYGFNKEYINALISDKETLDFFLTLHDFDPKTTAKRIAGPIAARMKENFKTINELPFSKTILTQFLTKAQEGKLMENQLKIIMNELLYGNIDNAIKMIKGIIDIKDSVNNLAKEGTINFRIKLEKNPEFKNINSNIEFMDKKDIGGGIILTVLKQGKLLNIIINRPIYGRFEIYNDITNHLNKNMMVTLTWKEKNINLYINGEAAITLEVNVGMKGKSIEEIIKEKGFDAPAMDESEIEKIVQEVVQENPTIVEQYKGGKTTTIGFFVGQVLKKIGGKANPKTIQTLIEKALA